MTEEKHDDLSLIQCSNDYSLSHFIAANNILVVSERQPLLINIGFLLSQTLVLYVTVF